MKNKILFILPLLAVIIPSCSMDNAEKSDTELNHYAIVYSPNSNYNEDSIAKEFKDTITGIERYKDITVRQLTTAVDYNQEQIYLKVNDQMDANTYSIKRNKETFVLTADSNTGLINAAKAFLQTAKSRPSFNLYDWYRQEEKETYESRTPLKIMTYNVRVGNDTTNASGEDCTRATRAPRIKKNILKYMPDSVGVQEYSEDWKSLLNSKLMPQYGFIGYGREATLTGETSGIFYNRDTVSLLESGTKWLSPTPNEPGTKFADSGKFFRIFTYGLFERHSDNFKYLHINTHFDLERNPRIEGANVINSFIQSYKNKYPIVLTGDFNNDKKNDDAVKHFIDDFGYVDCFDEDKDAVYEYTYPTSGYYKAGVFTPSNGDIVPQVIDYCLKPNKGLICEKYYCDTAKVSGTTEPAGPTSDHYPVYFELMPYEPFTAFEDTTDKSTYIHTNNSFSNYDKSFSFLGTTSDKNVNHITIQASNASHNGVEKDTNKSMTKYKAIAGLSKQGGYIEYRFSASQNQSADIVMVMSSSASHLYTDGNCVMDNLTNFATLTLNGAEQNVHHVRLRNDDINQWYEWEQVVMKNVNIVQGTNTVRLECKQFSDDEYYAPNQLLLEVFSRASLSF